MRTPLENLIFQTGFTYREFGDKVNVPEKTINNQLNERSHAHVDLAVRYAIKLNINKVEGWHEGKYVKIKIK